MSLLTNLKALLYGERNRLADIEYEIIRLERRLAVARLERESSIGNIRDLELQIKDTKERNR